MNNKINGKALGRNRLSAQLQSVYLQTLAWVLIYIFYVASTKGRTSLVAQMVKNLPAMQETPFRSLYWEDPLEEEMAIHSSILDQRIPWTEEPGGYSPQSHKESDMTE